MDDSPDLKKGFTNVDAQPDPAMLVNAMDATARWPAVQRLRAWERERLGLRPGLRVLDVGCGPGDVLVELAADIGDTGRAAGLDASEQMLAAAADRAAGAGVAVELQVGDAAALPFADADFDIVRWERTLQWVEDPSAAVAELVRVTAPGGRVTIIDTDWRTLLIDHPSPALLRRFLTALADLRGDAVNAGGRLVNLLRDARCGGIEVTAQTHLTLAWDPDHESHPSGFMPFHLIAADLAEKGRFPRDEAATFVREFEEAARSDRFFMSLTMFAASGIVPSG